MYVCIYMNICIDISMYIYTTGVSSPGGAGPARRFSDARQGWVSRFLQTPARIARWSTRVSWGQSFDRNVTKHASPSSQLREAT